MGLYNSYLDFENAVKALLSGNRYIPLIITFDEPLTIDGISKKPISELNVACTNERSRVMFEHKPDSKEIYYLSYLPFQCCSGVRVHPDFSPADFIANTGLYSNEHEFEKAIMNILTLNIRTSVVLEFSKPVFLRHYSLEPSCIFKITASILKLSPPELRVPVFKPRAVFYLKPTGGTFFYANHFPFHCITNIIPEKDFNPTIATRSRSGKTLNLVHKPAKEPTSDQISLYEIIAQSARKAKFRDDSHCVVCGSGISKDTTDFVRLLVNGNISNSYKLDSLHFDYLPVGSDCKHKFPESFVFSNKTIRDYCEQVKAEQKNNQETKLEGEI